MREHWTRLGAAVLLSVAAAGCVQSRQVRDREYAQLIHASSRATSVLSPVAAAEAVPPVVQELAGPQPVETYLQFALAQNPDLHAARKRVEAAANRVPQAASLEDPRLSVMGFPFDPNQPQTASGRTTVRMSATQEVPWFGTLRTRAAVAEAETEMARRQLAGVELEVIEQVKRAYYELFLVQRSIRIVEQDQKLLENLLRVAETLYQTGRTTQQDVLRAEVELANLENQRIQLRQEQAAARARLARLLHVSPETPLRTVDEPPTDAVPRDLERLYQVAVTARPELHARLAAIQRDRRSVELAKLDYYPDLAFTADWTEMTRSQAIAPTADGMDDVGVGMMVSIPIYRKRIEAGVREAEAEAVASAREYDALRDQTVEQVKILYTQAVSQHELVQLFRQRIVPAADQTLRVSLSAYEVGRVDFLQLVDNWRELLRYQLSQVRLEAQLQQTLASLDRVVGGELSLSGAAEAAPSSEVPATPQQPTPAPPEPLPDSAQPKSR